MFYVLHRIYMVSWAALVIGAIVWLYPRTGISEPLLDWYGVWQNTHGSPSKPMEWISGEVVRVTDANAFVLRGSDRQVYSIGLLGTLSPAAVSPKPGSKTDEPELAKEAKAHLSDLILSNQVSVEVTVMDRQRRGIGVVHLGDTNVNAVMVESGLLELKREFIKGLPLFDQYALIRADREARSGRRAAAE